MLAVIVSLASALPLPIAAADPAPSLTSATGAAEALFVEGKRLMSGGEIPKACAAFDRSEKLDPAPGTLLNLADCYEKNGQLASAWMTFREAATASDRVGRPGWVAQASERARLLEPRLPTLTVQIDAASSAPGTEVWCDHAPLARSAWGVALPVDLPHSLVEVRAPGKKPWRALVAIPAERAHVVVTVPALEDDAVLSRTPRSEPPPTPFWGPQRGGAFASVAVGILGLGLGAGLGIDAKSKYSGAERESGPVAMTDSTYAVHEGNVATAFAIGGGIAAAAGIVLWLTVPHARPGLAVVGSGAPIFGGSF